MLQSYEKLHEVPNILRYFPAENHFGKFFAQKVMFCSDVLQNSRKGQNPNSDACIMFCKCDNWKSNAIRILGKHRLAESLLLVLEYLLQIVGEH